MYKRQAYGSLVNAIKLGEQLDQSLPQKEVPEQTRGNEGFYLLNKFTGSIEKAELVYIIRDHDQEKDVYKRQTNHKNLFAVFGIVRMATEIMTM